MKSIIVRHRRKRAGFEVACGELPHLERDGMDGDPIKQLAEEGPSRRVGRRLKLFASQLGSGNLKLAAPLPEFLGLGPTFRYPVILESAEDRSVKINAQLHGIPTRLELHKKGRRKPLLGSAAELKKLELRLKE